MIITRTPVRVSFLGGGTDYPQWFSRHGGLVVGAAIDKYSYITARFLQPFHPYKSRVVYSAIECVQRNLYIQHRAIRAVLEHLGLTGEAAPGLEIFHAADLPGRSGTGSSSAFVVGLLNALSSLQGRWMLAWELAEAAIHVEQVRLGETVGCQDQTWAAHGGLNVIRFRPRGDISVLPLNLDGEQITRLEAHLMLFFTGISRTASEVAALYAPGLGERTREQWAMVRLAEEGIEAIYQGDYQRLGQLVDQSWRIKAGLADGVCTSEVSRLYAAARLAGAFGGKLTGAGGGGCLLLVAPPDRQSAIIKALEDQGALHVPFRFDFDGSVVIFADRRH